MKVSACLNILGSPTQPDRYQRCTCQHRTVTVRLIHQSFVHKNSVELEARIPQGAHFSLEVLEQILSYLRLEILWSSTVTRWRLKLCPDLENDLISPKSGKSHSTIRVTKVFNTFPNHGRQRLLAILPYRLGHDWYRHLIQEQSPQFPNSTHAYINPVIGSTIMSAKRISSSPQITQL